MPSELSRSDEATHEVGENLLIEAVSLLVQRQRETESWVAEQVCQAEERATETERRYAELATRLGGIEEQLDRLLREVEPGRSAAVDERLARLREQVEGLKSAADGRSVRAGGSSGLAVDDAPIRDPEPVVAREPERRPAGPPPRQAVAAGPQSVGFLELLGATPQDRWGFVLILAGAVAVVYAVLSQFFR